ncbi:hypothetical protein RI129_001490 [Pyrocoelia pectoralis]|uniref:Gustatory receptor n=1 Tax=Pyrocoelia pectoralis TaxID=417401 RepID=A0AAN7VUW8_9COLE
MNATNTGIKNVYYLFFFSRLCGISVPYQSRTKTNIIFKIYSFMFFLFITVLAIISLYYRIQSHYTIFSITSRVIDILDSSFLILLHGSCIISTTFCNGKEHEILELNLTDIEQFLHYKRSSMENIIKFINRESLLINISLLSLCVAYSIVWGSVDGFNIESWYTVKYFQSYIGTVGIYQMYSLNNYLRLCFKSLNVRLFKRLLIKRRHDSDANFVNHITNIHDNLCDVIDAINKIYGFPLLVSLLFFGLRLIVIINSLITRPSNPTSLVIAQVLWTLTAVILWTALVLSCDFLCEEVQETVTTAYKIIVKLPYPISIQESLVIKNIRRLIAQVVGRKVQFTAAGFMGFNRRIILSTFSTITVYVMIIVNMNY